MRRRRRPCRGGSRSTGSAAVAAALVPRRDATHVVARAGAFWPTRERVHRRALVQVRAVRPQHEARAPAKSAWFDECHVGIRQVAFSVTPRRRRNRCSGLRRGSCRPSSSPAPAACGRRSASPCPLVHDVHGVHLHLEEELHGRPDLRLGRRRGARGTRSGWPSRPRCALFSDTCGAISTVIRGLILRLARSCQLLLEHADRADGREHLLVARAGSAGRRPPPAARHAHEVARARCSFSS